MKRIYIALFFCIVASLIGFFYVFKTYLFNSPFSPSIEKEISSISDSVKIAVIGDFGLAGEKEDQVKDLVFSENPQAVLTVGDNNYAFGERKTLQQNIGQYYQEYINQKQFFPVLGNHDIVSENGAPYFEYFPYLENKRYYDFVLGSIHFFALDSNPGTMDGLTIESVQAQWLKSNLEKAKEPFKIVYFHHPPYSSGIVHGSSKTMQWSFKEWGATAVLSGHEHNYERIMQEEIPYIVNGLGGHPAKYPFGKPLSGSVIRYNDTYGAIFIKADDHKLEFTFKTVDNEIIDNYVVTK